MNYAQLGNTGLLVSRLCLGTMTFGDGSGVYEHIGNLDQSGADGLVKASVDAGINFLDTADTSVIVGAKRLDQLTDNLAAVDLVLSDDELARLDDVSALPPEYPGWMVEVQGADRLGPVDLWKNTSNAASAS